MTVLEDVRTLVTKIAPKAICDDCLAARLGLSVRQHANHKTRELQKEIGFDRSKAICDFCKDQKKVITYRARTRAGSAGPVGHRSERVEISVTPVEATPLASNLTALKVLGGLTLLGVALVWWKATGR